MKEKSASLDPPSLSDAEGQHVHTQLSNELHSSAGSWQLSLYARPAISLSHGQPCQTNVKIRLRTTTTTTYIAVQTRSILYSSLSPSHNLTFSLSPLLQLIVGFLPFLLFLLLPDRLRRLK